MKTILSLTLLLLFSLSVSAETVDITGVYEGTNTCGRSSSTLTVKIIHNPDNSVRVILSSASAGYTYGRRGDGVGMRGSFQGLGNDMVFQSPKLWNKLVVNAAEYKKRLRVRLDERCGDIYLERNSELSKRLISDVKKERKETAKAIGKNPPGADISYLNGFWIMYDKGREDYRLIFENQGAWIQKTGSDGYYLALTPEIVEPKTVEDAKIIFRPASYEHRNVDFEKVSVVYKPARSSFYSPFENIQMSLLTLDGEWSPKVELRRPTTPEAGSVRVAGIEAFVYQDWQQRKYDGYYLVKDDEARKRLRQTIDALYENGGWRCLAQHTSLVSPGRVTNVAFGEGGVNRLYLIYSPYGNSGLIYETIPPKHYGVVEPTQYDYPLFMSSHRDLFQADTRFSFSLQPSFSKPFLSSQEIPVTLFIFGRTFGDYGTGCEYYASKEVADRNFRNQVIGKIILAFLLEYGRRVSNEAKADLPQLATTAARNEFVKSLVHDFFPDKRPEEVEYITRWITLAMSGDFRPQNYARDTIRESILQKAAKEKPEYKFDLQVMDLLLDLVIQRRGW